MLNELYANSKLRIHICELGMLSVGSFKTNWKDLLLEKMFISHVEEKMFISLYIEEVNKRGKRGVNLNVKLKI